MAVTISTRAEDTKEFGRQVDDQQLLTADDLMRLQLEDDPLMLDDFSLCALCTHTCAETC